MRREQKQWSSHTWSWGPVPSCACSNGPDGGYGSPPESDGTFHQCPATRGNIPVMPEHVPTREQESLWASDYQLELSITFGSDPKDGHHVLLVHRKNFLYRQINEHVNTLIFMQQSEHHVTTAGSVQISKSKIILPFGCKSQNQIM